MTKIKESPIHGLGCFATRDFHKGKIIFKEYCPEIPEPLENIMEYLDDYGTYISLLGSNKTRYLNHSHENNAEWYYDEIDEMVILIAEKDIKEGEEITINYRITGEFE